MTCELSQLHPYPIAFYLHSLLHLSLLLNTTHITIFHQIWISHRLCSLECNLLSNHSIHTLLIQYP
ncbi:hypothetical protein MtrunA17_Chr1g0205261 [Medicago truncatula]|uniref:Uncharacterized protein n=1 Tax=Medicago truncatula TaxID=3880 RepID=I3S3G2_MEDTR|nr:unknown [Medicago truncatula]RHN82007.1 hypothetical protein MtrunA17_Chr1g0205261 [Medicago truncatula]